jgi:RNA polymerase sigma factor (sigma-70 family)
MRHRMESDEAQLRAWAAGDATAGKALFDTHFEAVLRFFRNKCGGDDGELEDLVQATFAQCLASHASFRGEASFRTYLFTIARHELYAHWRRRQRARGEIDVASTSVEDLRTSPRSKLAAHQDRQILARALREIPLELQVALELHYWEDLSGPPSSPPCSRSPRARCAAASAVVASSCRRPSHGSPRRRTPPPPRASTSSIGGPSAFGTPWAADRVHPAGSPCFVGFPDDLAVRARWS